jgi:hypothetical protein
LRPEDIVPHWPDEVPPEAETFAATITLSEMLGNETLLFAESASGPLIARQLPRARWPMARPCALPSVPKTCTCSMPIAAYRYVLISSSARRPMHHDTASHAPFCPAS